jgi:simple sugar transport system substrate-binding protein
VRRLLAVLAGALAVLVLAACGSTTRVQEPAVEVTDAPRQSTPDARKPVEEGGGVRIAVVTHGQASSPFWAIVRNGVEAAGRQMDALVNYRAPDVYSLERMEELVDEAVATRPDGLVVSLPEAGLSDAIRRAVQAGVPVVSINSGSDVAAGLGVLAHVGQEEDRAGLEAGRRLAEAGARRVLCVNQQVGNQGLDARCAGLARAMREAGGSSRVLGVDDMDAGTPKRIAGVLRRDDIDGVLALNATSGLLALEAAEQADVDDLPIGAFDLAPDVLQAVKAGDVLFAVDQQAYLQGYLPVVLLTQRARYGVFPGQGDVLPTGPGFVTRDDVDRVIELSRQSIR